MNISELIIPIMIIIFIWIFSLCVAYRFGFSKGYPIGRRDEAFKYRIQIMNKCKSDIDSHPHRVDFNNFSKHDI